MGIATEDEVSRTGLDPGLMEIVAEFLKNLDSVSPMSRTTLGDARAEVLRSFDDLEARLAREVGQKRPQKGGVTDHPDFSIG